MQQKEIVTCCEFCPIKKLEKLLAVASFDSAFVFLNKSTIKHTLRLCLFSYVDKPHM
jgi:hypothetical protein